MNKIYDYKKIERSFRRFSDYSDDLLNLDSKTFPNNLNIFIDFCENDEIMHIISAQLKSNKNVDIGKWYSDFQKTGGSFIGTKKYVLPTKEEDRISLLYQFLLKIHSNEINFHGFCIDAYGKTNFNEMVLAFNDAISRPLIRAMNQLLQETEAFRPVKLDDLINTDEGSAIEFKSSLRWDIQNNKVNKNLEKVIVKAVVGFMNSEGGTLLIGVMDDGQIFGIESDLKTLKRRNTDGFQQAIISLISDYLGTEFTKYTHIDFEEKEEKTVCKIKLERAPQPVFFKSSDGSAEFYIRAGNTTRLLDSRETHEYIQMHWGT